MSVLIVWASPNKDGLTAACHESACKGVIRGGKQPVSIHLNSLQMERCRVCGNGWGACKDKNGVCVIGDDFEELRRLHKEAEAVIIITAVYWHEMSEPAKAFYDRLRRFEAKGDALPGKKCIVIAAAGGTGNGAVNCLVQMDNTMKHLKMEPRDRLPITRFSREYMLTAIENSAEKLCKEIG